jgi:DNA-binding MarR family transcriptional regulator
MDRGKDFREAMHEWMHETMRHSMRGFVRYSKEAGISVPQIAALFRIQDAQAGGVAHVGEDLGITSAAASQMLERLVRQGLVRRIEDPADRRSKRLSITEKGMAIVQKGIYARQQWMGTLARSFSEDEKELIVKALKLLVVKLRAMDAEEAGCRSGSGRETA